MPYGTIFCERIIHKAKFRSNLFKRFSSKLGLPRGHDLSGDRIFHEMLRLPYIPFEALSINIVLGQSSVLPIDSIDRVSGPINKNPKYKRMVLRGVQ